MTVGKGTIIKRADYGLERNDKIKDEEERRR
jgi:hypothetical protein